MPSTCTSKRSITPVGALARGLAAGGAGTLAMDALLYLRFRRDGGQTRFGPWELTAELSGWEEAPAPALVGKRLVEGLFQRELPSAKAALVNNITHWAYGMLAGAQYGIVAASLARPRVRYGLPFGATVWATGYVLLPAAKLYKPIWDYDAKTLAKDLGAHLIYGLSVASTMSLLSRTNRRNGAVP
jgi:hypothetical protein